MGSLKAVDIVLSLTKISGSWVSGLQSSPCSPGQKSETLFSKPSKEHSNDLKFFISRSWYSRSIGLQKDKVPDSQELGLKDKLLRWLSIGGTEHYFWSKSDID